MNLISKTLLYYLLISFPLLVVAGFLSYHLISHELNDGLEEALIKEKLHLEKAITRSTDPLALNTNELDFVSLSGTFFKGKIFSDSTAYDSLERENVKYKILITYFTHKEKNYRIRIAKATMEEEELLEGLLSTFAVIGLFLSLAFFMVSWQLSKTLWKPFRNTLEKLEHYEIKNHSSEQFDSSNIHEFESLNKALNKMTAKIHSDFVQQKEFTENASHEMQTPLAVIKANLNLLMQSPALQSAEMGQLQAIEDTAKKLASLNKALLLLAKIENNQFKELEQLDFGVSIIKITEHFEDLIEAKKINLELKLERNIPVLMNPILADILITNLFQNSIRHNFTGGTICIENKNNELCISNTGEPLTISEEELFIRFKKNEASKDSLGLGLAIVKSICQLYSINLRYSYENRMHVFNLKFK